MNKMISLVEELKVLIIEILELEDTTPEDINKDEALFEDGLGLDSIDALEIGVALQKKYQIKLAPKGEDIKEHFYSVQTIANYLQKTSSKNG